MSPSPMSEESIGVSSVCVLNQDCLSSLTLFLYSTPLTVFEDSFRQAIFTMIRKLTDKLRLM